MYNVLSVEEVRNAEKATIDGGVDVMILRMNAALEVADGLLNRASSKGAKTAVFCGNGGNGFDGLLAAAKLKRSGCDVTAYLVFPDVSENRLASALAVAKNDGLEVKRASEYKFDADIIVDAIFGIGLDRAIEGETKELIEKLSAQDKAFKLAVDIPSGLSGDSGEILGAAFNADITMTFSCYKRGMLFGSGRDVCGKIIIADVGIATKSDIKVYCDADFKPFKRKKSAHKGDAGKIFVIGGCATMVGAPMMAGAAAHAAYLNGAGLVTVCVPSSLRTALASRSTLAMMKFLQDDENGFIKFDAEALDEIIEKADSIDIGIGMGKTPELKRILEYICERFKGNLIIDADALNAIAGEYGFLSASACKILITPHVGEFKRLTGRAADIENAVELAKEIGGIVVLKSATTVITDGKEIRLNITGTPAMAKGGTGDVLGGCITALSCSYPLLDAATIACYRNGLGAERAVSSYAEMMLTPKDILKMADYPELLK